MKKLALVLLLGATALFAMKEAPVASADCVHLRYYYYDVPGGTNCGLTYVFCNSIYHQGCETPYYNVYAGCACP